MTATLEFRGLDLLSALANGQRRGLRIQIVRGFLMPPEVRGEDYTVAALAGQVAGNRVADVSKIGLAGSVNGIDAEEFETFRLAMLAVMTEGVGIDPGALIARGPYMGIPAGAVASINVRVDNIIEGEVQAKLRQTFSIQLKSVDPAWTYTPPP